MTKDKRQDYLSGWDGRSLLKKHSLEEYGVWKVHGEDPNCDFGGSHVQPYLGTFEGKLTDIIDYAVELPKFWNWGSGGSISRVTIKKIDSTSSAKRQRTKNRIKELESELIMLKDELGLED